MKFLKYRNLILFIISGIAAIYLGFFQVSFIDKSYLYDIEYVSGEEICQNASHKKTEGGLRKEIRQDAEDLRNPELDGTVADRCKRDGECGIYAVCGRVILSAGISFGFHLCRPEQHLYAQSLADTAAHLLKGALLYRPAGEQGRYDRQRYGISAGQHDLCVYFRIPGL